MPFRTIAPLQLHSFYTDISVTYNIQYYINILLHMKKILYRILFHHFRIMAELQPKASGMIYISNITQLNSSNIVYLISVLHVELPTLCKIGISESTTSTSPISTLSSSPTYV